MVGRVTNVNSSNGVSSNYTYNERNTIESYTVKKNNTFISGAEYTYDSDGLLSDVTLSSANGAYFVYSYDSLNRITDVSHDLSGFPLQVEYSYLPGNSGNTTGLVSSILYSDGGYKYMPKLSYTYDNKGNIKTVSENDVLHITYTYDSLDRLVREDNKDLNQTVTYTYDTRGNILKKEYYAYTTGSLGSVTDTVTYTYDSTWKDKLLSYDGESCTYDNIGNPTTYRGNSLTWEKGRQLKSIGNLSFEYNIDGLRTKKQSSTKTTNYIWSSGLLMQQSDGTNTLQFSYAPDGRALGVIFNGSEYFYIYNLQGDVIGLYNYLGSVVVKYTYDSWGKLISTTGSLANTLGELNPFRYRGYIYDEETGFYWLRSRYYDPETGRFLNADGYVSTGTGLGGYNMFSYCNNNPIRYCDNTGYRLIDSLSVQNETSAQRATSCTHMKEILNNKSNINHIDKKHVTTPEAMLDFGPLIGKIGISSTVHDANNDASLFYSFVDIGNDMNLYGGGVNILEILSVEVGGNSNYNGFVNLQITPWVHGTLSLGASGIGAVIGIDIDNISYDFEIYAGWGTIGFLYGSYFIFSEYYPSSPQTVPANMR